MKVIVILALAVVLAAGGYKYYQDNQREAALAELVAVEKVYAKWHDTSRLARSTARISLAGPLKDLQSTARELNELTLSGCALQVRRVMAEGMANEIEGLMLFMRQAKGGAPDMAFMKALEAYEKVEAETKACRDSLT